MYFLLYAQPAFLAMQDKAKQWSHFPTASFWGLSPNVMLCCENSHYWNFFCRTLRTPCTFPKTRISTSTMPRDCSDLKCLSVILPPAHFICSQSMLTHITEWVQDILEGHFCLIYVTGKFKIEAIAVVWKGRVWPFAVVQQSHLCCTLLMVKLVKELYEFHSRRLHCQIFQGVMKTVSKINLQKHGSGSMLFASPHLDSHSLQISCRSFISCIFSYGFSF